MISKSDALDTAKSLYGRREGVEYTIHDYMEGSIRAFAPGDKKKLWCVVVHDDRDAGMLISTTIVLVHKVTGEVVFHGRAMDEG